jgi:hypothetical protein
MKRNEVRHLRERLHKHQLGDFADEAELDRAIQVELDKMAPEQAERAILEFAAENNLRL